MSEIVTVPRGSPVAVPHLASALVGSVFVTGGPGGGRPARRAIVTPVQARASVG